MNNNLLNIIIGKDRRRYNQIIQLIEQKKYSLLFDMDEDKNFGLYNQKYINNILKKIEIEVSSDPEFLIQMHKTNYHRAAFFDEIVIKSNPKIIERFIEEKIPGTFELMPMALDYGYSPESNYVNNHFSFFSNVNIINKLIESGYMPTSEMIESSNYKDVFVNDSLLLKLIDMGYVPSVDFIRKNNLLNNVNLENKLLNTIEIAAQIINSNIFFGNAKLQQKIISKKPELLLELNSSSNSFESFWIEAFKQGYMPEKVLADSSITGNLILFSKIIKLKPELIKYCQIVNEYEKNEIDELALCMGYVPTINDARESEYIKNSFNLMKALIIQRPEAITLVGESFNNVYWNKNLIDELANIALNHGFIPTEKHLKLCPILVQSFAIMNKLISENPNMYKYTVTTRRYRGYLFETALKNGLKDNLNEYFANIGECPQTLEFYHLLLKNGFTNEQVVELFSSSVNIMKEIISVNPNLILNLNCYLMEHGNIAELCTLAFDKGYVPQFENATVIDIFLKNFIVLKTMIKKFPNLIENIIEKLDKKRIHYSPLELDDLFSTMINLGYTGYKDKKNTIIRSIFNCSYEYMKKRIELDANEIEYCMVEDKDKYVELYLLALDMGYYPQFNNLRLLAIINNYASFEATLKKFPNLIEDICYYMDNKYDINLIKPKIAELFLTIVKLGYTGYKDIDNTKIRSVFCSNYEYMKERIELNANEIEYCMVEDQDKFDELCLLALDKGYNPTDKNKEIINHFLKSFVVQKVVVKKFPNLIEFIIEKLYKNEINISISELDDLLLVAIDSGYNGYKDINNNYRFVFYSSYEFMKKRIELDVNEIEYCEVEDQGKFAELCLLALDKGYVPKNENKDAIDIFLKNFKVLKTIMKKFPNLIENIIEELDKKRIHYSQLELDDLFLTMIELGYTGYKDIKNTKIRSIFNRSYEFMKKRIELDANEIEYCEIEDQGKFDELCVLALKKGYTPSKDISLLCSNYEMLTTLLKMYPDFLHSKDNGYVYEELNKGPEYFFLNYDDNVYNVFCIFHAIAKMNPEKLEKVINKLIEYGYNPKDFHGYNLKAFIENTDEKIWRKFLTEEQIKTFNKNESKSDNNKDNTFEKDNNLANNKVWPSKFAKELSETQLEIISCYPKYQNQILELSEYKEKIIIEIIKKYCDNLEWIQILEKCLYNINSSEFINLFSSINDKELSTEEKENFIYLLMTNNHLDISSYEELKNIDSIKKNYIRTLIDRNTLGSLKSAYFENVFGIDLTTAINLVKTYGKCLESREINSLDEESRKEFILLENMKKIINLNNIDVLKYYVKNVNPKFILKPDLMVTYEARLKYIFTKEFNKSFTKPLSEDKVISDIDDERNLDIYLAAGHDGKKKCRLMINSLGAYTSMKEPDNYYASWNTDDISSHSCCCSYVGEKNLGTSRIKYCCLGFTDYELGSLHLSAPYDLDSESMKDRFEIDSTFPPIFLLPNDMLSYTRHTHNETVWERRNILGGNLLKKQPSYVVYFVDNFVDRLTDLAAMKQWNSVKKASLDFSTDVEGIKRPLPIMVVEREKIAKSQFEIIQTKLNEFKTTLNFKLIEEIIVDYESNYAGNRNYHHNICQKYFPEHKQLTDSVVGEIIETIKKECTTEPDLSIQCINELEKVVRNEQEKYSNTKHELGQSNSSFNIEEALIAISELKSKFRANTNSVSFMINSCDENQRQFEKSDIFHINHELLESQLFASDVAKVLNDSGVSPKLAMYENEIIEEKVNAKLKVHGQRHIKNVLLYSTLIGQSVFQDKHDLDLIMLSAKYHDIGRSIDASEEHAESSARIAVEKLKDKCSLEDLAIISTIIEFHEIPRNMHNVDEVFEELARKNGVQENQQLRVRQMAEVLKDADALDRTRFINRARLDPNFLQYDISKQLVRFASSMQETYAIRDLKEFNCDEAISKLLKLYTPQEILRTIRHSTIGNITDGDIHSFINFWANSIVQKNDELESTIIKDGIHEGEGVRRGK